MAQKVIKVGNSAAITLSQSILDVLGVSVGGEVEIERSRGDASVVVRPKEKIKESRRDRVAHLTADFVERYKDDLKALADK